MKTHNQIADYCNGMLDLHKHHDYGPMGLQYPGDENIRSIACAVSVNLDVIEQAKQKGHNLLIVHHGLFWNNESRLDSPWKVRVDALEEAGITLLAYHLALDAHPKIGNNILLARNLGLGSLSPWEGIGWSGEYRKPMDYFSFTSKAMNKLDPNASGNLMEVCPLQGKVIHKVAVIAGGAAQYVVNAHRDGFDTFVTGEPQEPSYNLARDLGMNFFAFGHDKTERSGVQALARLVSREFQMPWEFIPQNNPV